MKDKSDKKLKRTPLGILIVSGARQVLRLCNNPMSIFGILLLAVSLTLIFVYTLAWWMGIYVNQYLQGLIFFVIPTFFVGGLAAVPLGIFRMHRRTLRRGQVPGDLEIQVKDPRFKGSIIIFIAVTVTVVFPVLSVSGYKLYHFTESTQFCGQICHTVMEPQATAHARSPHARVSCAECHIGSGASFFVKSKISGLRQVYAVLTDSYSRPIPPAITELRPARETCEECHWPQKFFGTQYKKLVHFSRDEFNTRREVDILLKTGGADTRTGNAEGIHMYMLATGTIEYRSPDADLQTIPWIKYSRKNDDVSIFRQIDAAEEAASGNVITRVVDCMDCHNRGAHHFSSPTAAVTQELELKRISGDLPFVAREAARALARDYDDAETAHREIEAGITGFYQRTYPRIWQRRRAAVETAVRRVQAIYDEQFFPKMNESWHTYPENVGHRLSRGCFRCHDGRHVDGKGRVINSECTACHLFMNSSDRGLPCLTVGQFQHPGSLSVHNRVLCSRCHGSVTYRSCDDCHKGKTWKALRGTGQFRLPTDHEGSRGGFKDMDHTSLEDATFRLEGPNHKTEWELTEPLRQMTFWRGDEEEAVAPRSGDPATPSAKEGDAH